MKTDREVIEGALALIEADGRWTQGTYAPMPKASRCTPLSTRRATGHGCAPSTSAREATGCAPSPGPPRGASACRGRSRGWCTMGTADGPTRWMKLLYPLECLLLRLARTAAASAARACRPTTTTLAPPKAANAVLTLKRAAAHLEAEEQEQS